MKKAYHHGFTLIELMIIVVVIGVLAAIAIPAYSDYVERARRADAKSSILAVQLEQEKWRANNTAYTSDLTDLGFSSADNVDSVDGFYTIDIENGASTAGYTVNAVPVGSQANDDCGTFTLTVTAASGAQATASGGSEEDCWQR